MKQLLLSYVSTPGNPTISSLVAGEVFLRPNASIKDKCIYMIVNVVGIRVEMKDKDGREYIICNLKTGSVFPANGYEEITPLPEAAVLENADLQSKFLINPPERKKK